MTWEIDAPVQEKKPPGIILGKHAVRLLEYFLPFTTYSLSLDLVPLPISTWGYIWLYYHLDRLNLRTTARWRFSYGGSIGLDIGRLSPFKPKSLAIEYSCAGCFLSLNSIMATSPLTTSLQGETSYYRRNLGPLEEYRSYHSIQCVAEHNNQRIKFSTMKNNLLGSRCCMFRTSYHLNDSLGTSLLWWTYSTSLIQNHSNAASLDTTANIILW